MSLSYIDEIQRQLIETYGLTENPDKPGVPLDVPDGYYPMIIERKLDHVRIVDGKINCCNFDDAEDHACKFRAALEEIDKMEPSDFTAGQGHLTPAFRQPDLREALRFVIQVVNRTLHNTDENGKPLQAELSDSQR